MANGLALYRVKCLLKVDKCSEDSYIGLGDFFWFVRFFSENLFSSKVQLI